MMQAILYVCHGSRIKEACDQAISFVERCQKQISAPIQEICFIELTEPNIAKGIETCVNKGATKIAVIPVLLLTANHAKHDIPEEIAKANERYPQVKITMGRPFGVHEKMIQIITQRIEEQHVPIEDDTMVLLVGRGSSDPEVKKDLQEIARLLQEKTAIPHVDICFLAAALPSLEDGLNNALHSNYKKIFVVPYLLFTGILIKRLENKLKSLSMSHKQFILCNYFGYHPLLQELLCERIRELVTYQYEKRLTLKQSVRPHNHNI
jgi:sirohydrochlorin ferrochelatase